MGTRFVAINVGTGDAFFLERADCTSLVDGGLAKGFPGLLTHTTGRQDIDVLVCTHNDADHANGVLEFLNAGYGVKECWLPATWLEALQRLLGDDTDSVLRDLIFEPEGGDKPLPERVGREGEPITAEVIERLLDREAEHDPLLDGGAAGLVGARFVLLTQPVLAVAIAGPGLWLDAARIQKIALAAARRQIPIRWFDPDTSPSGSNAGPLRVINAAEVRSIKRSVLSRRDVLRLTQVNRGSLVVYSPPERGVPGVLFSADSGFGFSARLPADPGMIVTAPHHGAADAENRAAYARLAREHPGMEESWTWVRSDKATPAGHSRPCDEYWNQTRKFCTRCRGSRSAGQHVALDGVSGGWVPSAGVAVCRCSRP